MFTMLFPAFFVEENHQMETKHSLVDTQKYRIPQTNEKKVGTFEIFEPRTRCSAF